MNKGEIIMKKFKFATIAFAAVLALGGGSVFASQGLTRTFQVEENIEVTVDAEDEALIKALENGEVKVIVEE